MRAGRIKKIFIANLIFYVTLIASLALTLFIIFGTAMMIRGLPDLLKDLILGFAVIIGFGSLFLINYFVWKHAKKKFKVKDSDIIELDA